MERYDKWTELQLQKECTRRYLDNDGQKVELTRRLVDDDKSKHEPRGTFSKLSDPTGKYEEAYIRSQTKFEKNCWYSILGSEIQFHEDMIKAKKAQLFEGLKKADKELKAAMQVKEARIAGYKGVKEVASSAVTGAKSTGAQRNGTNGSTGVKAKGDISQKGVGMGGGSQDHRTFFPTLKPAMTAIAQSPVSPYAPGPSQVPATEKSATVPAVPSPKNTPANETRANKNAANGSAPIVNKTYEPMPFVESAFHKTPPNRTRKPRANAENAAAEPEPKPHPKKFMTAAGAAYLKSLDGGDDTTDYDGYVAPVSSLKRPSQETEASISKKLRLNSEDVANPDLHPNLIEQDSVQSDLINIGYLFLPCEDEKKIRGDALSLLKHEYRTFAITEVRADRTGYFMVFEKTAKGDKDLKKCFELIDIEIDEKSFFDKNVTHVKMSKRDDAVEEPESESEAEPESKMEEVNLGYTYVPYKKPAPRRTAWRR